VTEYITKDSGERQQFDSGMKRDTESGKPRFDLIVPEGVPYEEQMLTRFAMLMSRGAEKYDARNWEQADSEEEIKRAKSSAFRHFFQWLCGERDEDHAVAVMFNLMVVETIEPRVKAAEDAAEDALSDLAAMQRRVEEHYAERDGIMRSRVQGPVPGRFDKLVRDSAIAYFTQGRLRD